MAEGRNPAGAKRPRKASTTVADTASAPLNATRQRERSSAAASDGPTASSRVS